jgi:hypothetical protein
MRERGNRLPYRDKQARFDAHLLTQLESGRATLALWRTIPGIDLIGAARRIVMTSMSVTLSPSATFLSGARHALGLTALAKRVKDTREAAITG